MGKPITLKEPNAPVTNADAWLELNRLVGGHPDFTPVEVKSFYVFGLIEDICKSVDWMLKGKDAWPDRYLPAFGVFASGIDLLGRCLTGNFTHHVNQNLEIGFYYLANPTSDPAPKGLTPEQVAMIIVQTTHSKYSVNDFLNLRNYSAHGQAITKHGLPHVDNELLSIFPPLMGEAMETYWHGLINDREKCLRMGQAEIGLYPHRYEPLRNTLRYYAGGGNPLDMFGGFNWRV